MKLRAALLALIFLVAATMAQNSTTSAPVPRLVKISGVLHDGAGKALSGVAGVTFSLYKDEEGGAPLWSETQNVQVTAGGHYTATVGENTRDGLPADLFAAGQARWLGVQVAGQSEQPRILLLSVPYALKAADADTIGGLPPSAFVLAGSVALSPASSPDTTAPSPSGSAAAAAVTGTGTANYIPLWTTATALGSSVLYQSGSGATAKVGIGTTAPGATLDVKGGANVEGVLKLPATAAATAAAGKKSQPLDTVASSFNSSTKAAVTQDFRWQAEPLSNNTASPSGTLNLLFGAGTAVPGETGLKISNKGIFAFAPGQAFPGTIRGVMAGTDMTGGGTTGTVTLNLDTTKVPQLATPNIFTANQTVNGTLSATSSSGTGVAGTSGSGSRRNRHEHVCHRCAGLEFDERGSLRNQRFLHWVIGPKHIELRSLRHQHEQLWPCWGVRIGEWHLWPRCQHRSLRGEHVSICEQRVGRRGTQFEQRRRLWRFRGRELYWGILRHRCWRLGDTGDTSAFTYSGVVGTADNKQGGAFYNNGLSYASLSAANFASITGAIVLSAGLSSFCITDVGGNLFCTGSKSAMVPVEKESRQVALYAVEAPENWFEDAGSARLTNGETVVRPGAGFWPNR